MIVVIEIQRLDPAPKTTEFPIPRLPSKTTVNSTPSSSNKRNQDAIKTATTIPLPSPITPATKPHYPIIWPPSPKKSINYHGKVLSH